MSLNKFIIYFNELSRSVASLFEDRSAPIKLNKDLAIVQNELSAIQAESLHNELLAKQEEKRKNELIAYIAHDIRTPLTSIMGYVSLLQNNKNLSVKRREQYTAIIHVQSQKLSSMLDDFFDIARFNLQEITIKAQSIDLYTLCLQIAEDLYPAASNKELEIVVDAPLNSLCECDPKQIARAYRTSYAMPSSMLRPNHHHNTSQNNRHRSYNFCKKHRPNYFARILRRFLKDSSGRIKREMPNRAARGSG